MTMQDKDQQFVDAIKSELKESVDNINARDLSAITQARYQALECQQTSSRKMERKYSWMFFPAGAIAMVCLAVVVYNFIPVTPVSTDGQSLAKENQTRENQELVSTLEGFDFNEDPEISEELDFYEWLDAYESSS